MGSEWSNVETMHMWVFIGNEYECYHIIQRQVPVIYNNHKRCSVFSRRDAATAELADFIKSEFNRDLKRFRWHKDMAPWAQVLFKCALDKVNWAEMAKVLIENHEYAYNLESTL